MGLRELAAADNRSILEDTAGFGWPIRVTDPAGTVRDLVGVSTDVWQAIDPQTGTLVSGRTAEVTLSIAALTAAGLAMPKGVPDKSSKPWRVRFNDVAGAAYEFKVAEARPDLTLGCVLCILEAYKP